jgi:hypothetical protein
MNLKTFAASIVLLPSVVFAFPIAEIECTDPSPTTELNVYLTTNDEATHKYPVQDDTIAYDLGNKNSPFGDFQAGLLSFEPKCSHCSEITLVQKGLTKLSLTPSGKINNYDGKITGPIETSKGWGTITDYRVLCTVR